MEEEAIRCAYNNTLLLHFLPNSVKPSANAQKSDILPGCRRPCRLTMVIVCWNLSQWERKRGGWCAVSEDSLLERVTAATDERHLW